MKNLSQKDNEFLNDSKTQEFLDDLKVNSPILRSFLGKEEIKIANKLAKLDIICKGTSVDRKHTVQFSVW